MRAETITKYYYTFEELSKDRQELEIEKIRNDEYYLDYEWYEGIEEDFKTILELLGFYDIETYFSGFYSQGDGASFEARWDREKYLTRKIKDYAPKDEELYSIAKELQGFAVGEEGIVERTQHTNYYHSNTMTAEIGEGYNKIANNHFTALCRDLADWYYSRLDEQYEYLMSDEAIVEHMIANEYEFEGK